MFWGWCVRQSPVLRACNQKPTGSSRPHTSRTSSVLVNGAAVGGSKWTTSGVNIYYNSGNVGIGASTTPNNLLELTNSSYTGALLSLDTGVANAGAGVMTNAIGKPQLRLGRGFRSAAIGDYYGIGFGYAPLVLSNSCCEIGVITTGITGN